MPVFKPAAYAVTIIIPIALSFSAFSAFAQSRELSCRNVIARADYERAWDEVIADKQMALEEGIRDLKAIRARLESDRAEAIGATGSGHEVGIVLAIWAREVADLTGRMVSLFKPTMPPSEVKKMKIIAKAKKIVEGAIKDSNKAINERTKDISDRLPTFIPGIQAVRDIRDWTEAKAEVSKQTDNIEATIRKLENRLAELGGRERAYSVDGLLKMSDARVQRCEDRPAPATPPITVPPASVQQPPETPKQRPVTGSGAAPIKGACSITGTC